MSDLLSKCCKKFVIINTYDEGTSFYYCSECGKPTDPMYPDQFVDTNKKIDTSEQKYPCRDCGVLRTKEEGGTTFTVCDDCWDKSYKKPPRKKDDSKPPDECHCHQNCPGAYGGKKIGKDKSVSCLCFPRDCEHCIKKKNKFFYSWVSEPRLQEKALKEYIKKAKKNKYKEIIFVFDVFGNTNQCSFTIIL